MVYFGCVLVVQKPLPDIIKQPIFLLTKMTGFGKNFANFYWTTVF